MLYITQQNKKKQLKWTMTQGLYSETKANFVSIKNAFSCKYQKTQPTGASNKGQSLLDYVKSGYIQSPNWFGIQMMSRLKQWSQLVPLLQAWPHITHPKAGNTWRPGSEHEKLFSFNGKEKIKIFPRSLQRVFCYISSAKRKPTLAAEIARKTSLLGDR